MEKVFVCVIGELRWRDAMRPRLRPRCKIAPISVALDETPTLDETLPPDHFLKTGSFAGNLDLSTFHWIQCDTDFKCVQRNLSFYLLLSWAACSNISSRDYSWPVDGTATGNILAFINSLQLILLSFDKQPCRLTYKVSQKRYLQNAVGATVQRFNHQ